jgi:hypothetical protein
MPHAVMTAAASGVMERGRMRNERASFTWSPTDHGDRRITICRVPHDVCVASRHVRSTVRRTLSPGLDRPELHPRNGQFGLELPDRGVLRSRVRLRSRRRSRSQRKEFRAPAISRISMMDAGSAQALACAMWDQSSRTAVQGEADRKRGVSGACDNVAIRPLRVPNGLRRLHRLRRRR